MRPPARLCNIVSKRRTANGMALLGRLLQEPSILGIDILDFGALQFVDGDIEPGTVDDPVLGSGSFMNSRQVN